MTLFSIDGINATDKPQTIDGEQPQNKRPNIEFQNEMSSSMESQIEQQNIDWYTIRDKLKVKLDNNQCIDILKTMNQFVPDNDTEVARMA